MARLCEISVKLYEKHSDWMIDLGSAASLTISVITEARLRITRTANIKST